MQNSLLVNRYQLTRRLGQGAMGQVWLAEDTLLHRHVAIKHLIATDDFRDVSDDLVKRAMREARLAAQLNHPNAVQIFDLVMDDGVPYVVMEHVDGTSAADVLKSSQTMSESTVHSLLTEIASALAAAHALGVVHRDVKPGNILISNAGRAKLADFGIAKASTDSALTGTGLIIGTLAYMAPEVADGAVADSASDIWSLGATAYAMLEGAPPFASDNSARMLIRKVTEPVPDAANAGRLTNLLRAMLNSDPKMRPTAAAIAAWDGPKPTNVGLEPTFVPAGRQFAETVTGPRPVLPGGLEFRTSNGTAQQVVTRRNRRASALVGAGVCLVAAAAATVIVLSRHDDSASSAGGRSPVSTSTGYSSTPSAVTPGAVAAAAGAGQTSTQVPSPAATTAAPAPAYVPSLPSSAEAAAKRFPLPGAPTGRSTLSYTDGSSIPLSLGQLVDWSTPDLSSSEEAASAAVENFALNINRQDFNDAWAANTYSRQSDPTKAWEAGYTTARFYQLVLGHPQQISQTLVVVPASFVYRQDGVKGNPKMPDCTYWPQYVFVVARVNGTWLKDDELFQSAPQLTPFKRRSPTSGHYYLNPDASSFACS